MADINLGLMPELTEEEKLILQQQAEQQAMPTQPLEQQIRFAQMAQQATPKTNLQQIQEKLQSHELSQAKQADVLRDYMNKYAQLDQGTDYRPLASFVASLRPENKFLAQAAESTAPESEATRQKNMIGYQAQLAKLTGDQSAQNQMMKFYNDQQRLDIERARADRADKSYGLREDKQTEDQVRNLMNSLDKVNASNISQKISRLNENIPGGVFGTGDIPGVGVSKKWAPGYLLSDEGTKVRQDAQAVLAEVIRAATGMAATDAERLSQEQVTGLAASSTATQFRNGLQNLLNDNLAKIKATEAGYSPRVKEIYKQRGGVSSDKLDSIFKGGGEDGIKEWQGKKYKIQDNRWVEVK